jgi:hypothetical protein
MDFRIRAMPSKAPGGYGTVSRKGYRRISIRGRQWMEHILVWQHANGPIPEGLQLHHLNGDKLDNRLENLELVDALTHKRLHGGCEVRNGEWWKPCRKCGEWSSVDNYYARKDGISPWCKPCSITNAVENKRKRKAARASND